MYSYSNTSNNIRSDNKSRGIGINNEFFRLLKKQKTLVFMSIPFFIYIFLFNYLPVWGWIMAFQDYKPYLGIRGSSWVGLEMFKGIFADDAFYRAIRNTLAMSGLKLVFGFISAIAVAIMLNEIKNFIFKRYIQMISYLPHFVSWVVAGSIIVNFLSVNGPVNNLLTAIGIIKDPVLWLSQENYFWFIIAVSDVWKEVGWNTIIYLAAIAAIEPYLYEAAEVDGSSRIQKIIHITIPGIMPTVSILLIMQVGQILNTGFEQQMLIGNSLLINVSEVLDLYVFRFGINLGRFSYATAAGMFKTVVSIILLLTANRIAKRMNGERVI